MKRLVALLLALPMLTLAANAQSPTDGGRQLESHYFSVGLGYPLSSYPDDTRRLIEDLESYSGVSRVPLDLAVATYWPIVDSRTLLGAAIEVTGDHLSRGDESIGFNVMTLAASARRYVTGVVGDGLYGRIDAGLALAGVSHRLAGETYSESGNVGFGGAAGAGWAFPVSSGTSIELTAAALYRRLPGHETGAAREGDDVFEEGSYLSGTFGVGVLW